MISKKLSNTKIKSRKVARTTSRTTKRNPEYSKKDIENWMFSYVNTHPFWNPQSVSYAAIQHFGIKVESPYNNWIINLANKWEKEEERIRNKSPSKIDIKRWMLEHITTDKVNEYTGSALEIRELARKAQKHFKLKDVDLSELAEEVDEEFHHLYLRFS